jgi:hypothetical protein
MEVGGEAGPDDADADAFGHEESPEEPPHRKDWRDKGKI